MGATNNGVSGVLIGFIGLFVQSLIITNDSTLKRILHSNPFSMTV
jgi:hypothetical protein